MTIRDEQIGNRQLIIGSNSMEYILHILILIGIYIMLASSLNLVAGYTGMLSMAHAAFYGVGAYTVALMSINLQTPFLLNLFCAAIVCGLFGATVGIPSLRIKDDYFIIATFAFQIITFSVLNNWIDFTRGPMGLPGIPQPQFFGWTVSSYSEFLLLTVILCVLCLLIVRRIVHSPYGRVLQAIREDEKFALASGKNVFGYKMAVFILAAMLAAIPGALYATYITYIDPTSFTVDESIFIISIMIIGGAGSFWGPIVGAIVLVALPELLRFVGLPSSVAANIRQMLYGGTLVACMLWRPQGLMGKSNTLKK